MRTPFLRLLLIAFSLQACSPKADEMIFGPDPIGQISSQSAQFGTMSEPDRKILFAFVAQHTRSNPDRVVGRRVADVLVDARKWSREAAGERRTKDYRNAAERDLATLVQALALHRLDTGALPAQAQGLEGLMHKPTDGAGARKWSGPYLVKLPTDLWGNQYQYSLDATGKTAQISSFGADGKLGGTGAAKDIVVDAR